VRSAYGRFCDDRRDAITAELKEGLADKISKYYKNTIPSTHEMVELLLGEEWQNLSDGEKAKYVAMEEAELAAEAERERRHGRLFHGSGFTWRVGVGFVESQ